VIALLKEEPEMYLTRFLLDPRDRLVRKVVSNRYELHRALLSAFPDLPREEIGLLYRLERSSQDEMRPLELLAQTQVNPHWSGLLTARLPTQSVEVKAFQLEPVVGEMFYFRLEGNPTIRRNEGDYAGKRVELRSMEEQSQWMERKASQHGFQLLSLESTDLGKVLSTKLEETQKHIITHQSVLYQGSLEVTDPGLFVKAIKGGIGGAKGFGFGLLSLAK
jgi:CRISPR system Cascade subunit CasE